MLGMSASLCKSCIPMQILPKLQSVLGTIRQEEQGKNTGTLLY